MADQRDADIARLQRALDTKLSEETREAFDDMLTRLDAGQRELTEKQRAWVQKVLDEPTYANDWSAGRVPRGREVPTPAALQNLPKRPPVRRTNDDG